MLLTSGFGFAGGALRSARPLNLLLLPLLPVYIVLHTIGGGGSLPFVGGRAKLLEMRQRVFLKRSLLVVAAGASAAIVLVGCEGSVCSGTPCGGDPPVPPQGGAGGGMSSAAGSNAGSAGASGTAGGAGTSNVGGAGGSTP